MDQTLIDTQGVNTGGQAHSVMPSSEAERCRNSGKAVAAEASAGSRLSLVMTGFCHDKGRMGGGDKGGRDEGRA
jgi:hypothetical protein